MRRLTTLEQPPFLLAIFFAGFAWTITHYVGILEKSPIIGYTLETKISNDSNFAMLTLENLSSNTLFEDLEFTIHAQSINEIVIEEFSPAWQGRDPPIPEEQSVAFKIPKFHPGWKFMVKASYQGDTEPSLHLTSSHKQAIKFINGKLLIYVIKFQAYIIIFLLLLWGLITTIIYVKEYRKNNQSQKAISGNYEI